MTPEQWKWISGYEGKYEISDCGNVRSYLKIFGGKRKDPVLLAINKDEAGYKQVGLFKDDKQLCYRIHRLVLFAFKGVPPDGCESSHLNGNLTDNRPANLVWESHTDNIRRKAIHAAQRLKK